jgi:hypothetical protein
MFRTACRLTCILLVASAVAAVLLLIVDGTGGSSGTARRRGLRGHRHDARQDLGNPTLSAGSQQRENVEGMGRWESDAPRGARTGGGERGDHSRFSPGRGVAGVCATLAQVGLVAAVVAGLQKRTRRKLSTAARES